MRTLTDQHAYYRQNWEQCVPLLGSTFMNDDPEPIYWIGIRPSPEDAVQIDRQHNDLKLLDPNGHHRWLLPQELHVTLALPGRPGQPYSESDYPNLINTIRKISTNIPPFKITVGDISCFPSVIFREVYSENGTLFGLHNAIADAIPVTIDPEYRYDRYTPHMSVCYLKKIDHNMRTLKDFNRHVEPVSVTIESLHCGIAYDEPGKLNDPIVEIALGTGDVLL